MIWIVQTITMWQSVPEPAPTVELFAGKDAVCIAAIGATMIDGSNWGWVGDWGEICGLPWYYSGVKVSNIHPQIFVPFLLTSSQATSVERVRPCQAMLH